MDVPEALDFLLGSWTLERLIDDGLSGARWSFTGMATVVRGDPEEGTVPASRARYAEEGELRSGTQTSPATRRLDCVRADDGAVTLYFCDGRRFVDLDLRSGSWRDVHLCGDDSYEVTTTVRSENLVEERWRVRGPAKHYVAVATLTRTRQAHLRHRQPR